jgi:DUF1365 family protein
MTPSILFGRVSHARASPLRWRFRYRSWFLMVPLSRMAQLGRGIFSVNGSNVLSLLDIDHGPRDGSPLLPWIRSLLGEEGIHSADGEVWMITMPRVFGYVFNPVSFWLCLDRQQQLRAVLCEVSNTFGEHHNYLLAHADQRPIRPEDELSARKVFHVSPFLPLDGGYRFHFSVAAAGVAVQIQYRSANGQALFATLEGRAAALDRRNLWRALLLYPFMTLGVMARIHWQGLRLWLRRVPLIAKPSPPAKETTR